MTTPRSQFEQALLVMTEAVNMLESRGQDRAAAIEHACSVMLARSLELQMSGMRA